MKQRIAVCGLLGLTWPASAVLAQEATAPAANPPPQQVTTTPAPGGGYVTREEYDKLQTKLDTVIGQMADMKKQQAASQADLDATIEEIEKNIRETERSMDMLRWGSNRFTLAGDGEFGFTSQRKNNSTFDAGFSPIFLFELDKNILFEGALDISGSTDDTNSSSTTTDLTLANLTFTLNDWLYVGGGLFAVPFGRYHPHFDPSWINKLPDDPLAFGDRALGPSSETGLFAGGATPINDTKDSKIEYNAYVTNGPNLIVNDPGAAGSLNFDDFTDLNNGKAVGGRIGYLPISAIDVGYSIQWSKPSPAHDFPQDITALLQAVDAQYKQDIQPIAGTLEVRAEWIWSNVSRANYVFSDGTSTGKFDNNRNGGYAMVAYRPSLVSNKIIKNLEFIVRYDAVFVPKAAPGGGDENRWTFGIDYWITPSIVLKTAYQIDERQLGAGQNAFYFQCGFGL